jgi:PilZ domain
MIPKRIDSKEVIDDIRAGLTDMQLMEKYRLSSTGLEDVFVKLVAVRVMNECELRNRGPLRQERVRAFEIRQGPRSYLSFPLSIYEAESLDRLGHISDISESGLQIVGLRESPGRFSKLLIRADEVTVMDPFRFEAMCRWCSLDPATGVYTAGFTISHIANPDRRGLDELLNFLAIAEQ